MGGLGCIAGTVDVGHGNMGRCACTCIGDWSIVGLLHGMQSNTLLGRGPLCCEILCFLGDEMACRCHSCEVGERIGAPDPVVFRPRDIG